MSASNSKQNYKRNLYPLCVLPNSGSQISKYFLGLRYEENAMLKSNVTCCIFLAWPLKNASNQSESRFENSYTPTRNKLTVVIHTHIRSTFNNNNSNPTISSYRRSRLWNPDDFSAWSIIEKHLPNGNESKTVITLWSLNATPYPTISRKLKAREWHWYSTNCCEIRQVYRNYCFRCAGQISKSKNFFKQSISYHLDLTGTDYDKPSHLYIMEDREGVIKFVQQAHTRSNVWNTLWQSS